METILIFGATGTIGVYTTLQLKSLGYNVIAIGKRESDNGFFADKGIKYYSMNIEIKSSFSSLPKDVYAVIHLAGSMPARMNGYDPYQYIDSIIVGTLNVLEYMREINCNKIIFSQSISDILYKFGTTELINDDVERKFPLTGDHSIYSISKNAAVNLIEHYHAQYGFKRFILRLPTIYLYHPNPYYYVNGVKKWMGYRFIINQAIKGKTLEIWGNPNSIKEMVYVKDLVQLIELCVKSDIEGGIYNVGSGNPISIEQQIEFIADLFATAKKSDIIYCPEKPSSPQFVLNIEKAQKDLGYNPKYNFYSLIVDFKKEMISEPFAKLWGRACDYIM